MILLSAVFATGLFQFRPAVAGEYSPCYVFVVDNPADGATGVLTNPLLIYEMLGISDPEQESSAVPCLLDSDDQEVALDKVEKIPGGNEKCSFLWTPAETLQTESEYRVLSACKGGYELASFTTGDEVDEESPAFTLVPPDGRYEEGVRFEGSADIAVITARCTEEGSEHHITFVPEAAARFGEKVGVLPVDCVIDNLNNGMDVTLTAYDAAGNSNSAVARGVEPEEDSGWCATAGKPGAKKSATAGWLSLLLAGMFIIRYLSLSRSRGSFHGSFHKHQTGRSTRKTPYRLTNKRMFW